jgi:hypothetical protein
MVTILQCNTEYKNVFLHTHGLKIAQIKSSSIPQILYQNRENIHFLHISQANRANKKGLMLRWQ